MEEITSEKLKELVNLPHGKAAEYIRSHCDPLFGLPKGEEGRPVKFKVLVSRWVRKAVEQSCEIEIEALTADEAQAEAMRLANDRRCSWNDNDDGEIVENETAHFVGIRN